MEFLKTAWYRYRLWIVGGLVVAAAAVSVLFSRAQSEPLVLDVTSSPTPAASEAAEQETIVVDIQGAVNKPGVKKLPAGSLVTDAVAAAGGFTQDADRPRIAREVNQAEELKDHQKVYLPLVGETVADAAATPTESSAPETEAAGGLVDINTATAEELDTLPGVGPATAEKIIEYREAFGPFESVEGLLEVSGIGEAKLEKMREQITV